MIKVGPGLEVRVSGPVQAAIEALGRTEDLRFSPGNGLLAIAGLERNRCLILRCNVHEANDCVVVSLTDFAELTCPTFRYPHGLDFIDDETLVVANRGGGVSILRLPEDPLDGRSYAVEPIWHFPGGRFRWMRSPGSVAVRREPGGLISLLICNNYSHRVTRLVLDATARYRLVHREVFLRRGLSIPDGIVVSHDGAWIAVSSHGTHDVKLFSTLDTPGPDTEPSGTLASAGYPHGIQFTQDDRHILVADAGSQVVNVYERGESWLGEHVPARSTAVLDEATFARGRHNPEEGGPKGLAIDRTGRLVAITNEEQPLALYALRYLIEPCPDQTRGVSASE